MLKPHHVEKLHFHFPTFMHWGIRGWSWYRGLRIFEHVLVTVGFLLFGAWVAYALTLSPVSYFPSSCQSMVNTFGRPAANPRRNMRNATAPMNANTYPR